MNFVEKLKEKAKSKLLTRKIEKGDETWGRTETEVIGNLSAVIYRADGTVEDLGIISEVKK